jgi:hypothetical protein
VGLEIPQERSLVLRTLQEHFQYLRVCEKHVPLFCTREDRLLELLPYGVDGRLVLKRSDKMESLMRGLGKDLIRQYDAGQVCNDGILYMMHWCLEGEIIPLYIGKTETFGRKGENLSVNIKDLDKGDGKFGRWGYGYAYHLGDLSAATLPGHEDSKSTPKYRQWRDRLFDRVVATDVHLRHPVYFFAMLWGDKQKSIWSEVSPTTLAFEEYLLIGLASREYGAFLLNQEGRDRSV